VSPLEDKHRTRLEQIRLVLHEDVRCCTVNVLSLAEEIAEESKVSSEQPMLKLGDRTRRRAKRTNEASYLLPRFS
jgi:hypothetical protein